MSGDKKAVSVSSVDDFRAPLWPVSRQSVGAVIETPWGEVRFDRGMPTAKHQDILTAIAAVAKATKIDEVGRLHIVFDVPDVQKITGCDDWGWLKPKLDELTTTLVHYRKPGATGWGTTRTVLAGSGDTQFDAPRKPTQIKAKLKEIVFSEIMSQLVLRGMLVYMTHETASRVLSLSHQVSRSVARFCLSHTTNQTHSIQTVLDAVGATNCGVRMRQKYAKQLSDDAEGMKSLGITVDQSNKVIRYERIKGVWFDGDGWQLTTLETK